MAHNESRLREVNLRNHPLDAVELKPRFVASEQATPSNKYKGPISVHDSSEVETAEEEVCAIGKLWDN